MLLLFLSLFILCDLFKCSELETANSTTPLRTHPNQKPRRFDNPDEFRHLFTKKNSNGTQNPHPPEFYSNSTDLFFPDRSTTTTTPATVQTPSRIPEEELYPDYDSTRMSPSPEDEISYITFHPPGFTPEFPLSTAMTVDPSIAEFAKKWLEEVTATTQTEKLRVPKLGNIFGYDFSTEEFPSPLRRHRKTSPRSTNQKQLKNKTQKQQTRAIGRQRVTTRKQLKINTHRYQTLSNAHQRVTTHKQLKINTLELQTVPIGRQGVTVASTTKIRNSRSEVTSFWHDPPDLQSSLPQTVTKTRLKPDLLLGKVSLSDLKRPIDVGVSEKITQKYGSKGILRDIEKITPGSKNKGILRMEEKPKMMLKDPYHNLADILRGLGTTAATHATQFVRHKIMPFTTTPKVPVKIGKKSTTRTKEISTTPKEISSTPKEISTTPNTPSTSTTKSKTKTKEVHREGHLLVFLMELTRLIATKKEEDVHHVVKHADKIIHSYHKNRQLRWLARPLGDVVKKINALIRDSETSDLQKEAANLHQMLRQRHQILSHEMNTVIEYTDQLYDEEDGRHLQEVLNEFALYPNVTLSGYWVCNSLVINFLRPYRRLKDKQQRQHLINSMKSALGNKFALGAHTATTQEELEVRFETTKKEDSDITRRTTIKAHSEVRPGKNAQEVSEVTPETTIHEDSDVRLEAPVKEQSKAVPGTTVMEDGDDRLDTGIQEDSKVVLETTIQGGSKVTSELTLTNVTDPQCEPVTATRYRKRRRRHRSKKRKRQRKRYYSSSNCSLKHD